MKYMYPQYPTRGGIEGMREYLETRSDKSISSNSLCDLASIILKNNYFENEELKVSSKKSFCYWDQGLQKRIFQNSEFEPFLWLRYLDEIFCTWTQGSQKLKELFNCINSLHPTIKLTTDYSTTIDKFEADLYCKLNDTHHSLHAQSFYRYVYKRFVAYRQVVRFKRICSVVEKLNNRLEQLKQWYMLIQKLKE